MPHLLVDGSAVGWLDQDFDASVGELFDVTRGQRRPPLPGVDVLASDGHDGPVVLIATLACEAARRPPTLVTEESEHVSPPCSGQDASTPHSSEMLVRDIQEGTHTVMHFNAIRQYY